uniref:Secreted protein n=1 Tax=Glossina palpalis gambiensis TaxID=67801 RepID=A0A1B0B3V8_9MUSC
MLMMMMMMMMMIGNKMNEFALPACCLMPYNVIELKDASVGEIAVNCPPPPPTFLCLSRQIRLIAMNTFRKVKIVLRCIKTNMKLISYIMLIYSMGMYQTVAILHMQIVYIVNSEISYFATLAAINELTLRYVCYMKQKKLKLQFNIKVLQNVTVHISVC